MIDNRSPLTHSIDRLAIDGYLDAYQARMCVYVCVCGEVSSSHSQLCVCMHIMSMNYYLLLFDRFAHVAYLSR